MKIRNTTLGLLAVAGLAFAAGRSDLLRADASALAAPPEQETGTAPEMDAMMKAGTPGPHHAYLEPLVGTWDGVFRMWMEPNAPVMEMTGTIEREWVLDGHYLAEKVESETDFGQFHGLAYLGYNNMDGQYEMIWMDSLSTAIMSETGTYNPETKIMSTRGTHRDPVTGHVMIVRGELDLSQPDRHVYRGYQMAADGREFKAFEGITERR